MKAGKTKGHFTGDKNHLSRKDLQTEIKTFEKTDEQHPAFDTPEGKNKAPNPQFTKTSASIELNVP